MNYKELICLQQRKELVLTTQKNGCCMNGKNDWKSLLGENYLLEKPVHFSVKNTANNADTWGFTQQFFQHMYRTTNSIDTRQYKFSDIGNSTFCQEEYITVE